MSDIDPTEAAESVVACSSTAIEELNSLARRVLKTRGGRAGSGLGSLMEALWGFMLNTQLADADTTSPIQLAWFPDHAYNDFAVVHRDKQWNPTSGEGELLRVEAKSMYEDADESKAHFHVIQSQIGEFDLLLTLIWRWLPARESGESDRFLVAPQVIRSFIGPAMEIAEFRDALHLARGGSFVDESCPDGCPPGCIHKGEPLNADGKRERRTGPESCKPNSASYAANFGGLVRMLKTNSDEARRVFRKWRAESDTVHRFISFIHDSFPAEELSQYLAVEWRTCAERLEVPNSESMGKKELHDTVRRNPNYRSVLRDLYR